MLSLDRGDSLHARGLYLGRPLWKTRIIYPNSLRQGARRLRGYDETMCAGKMSQYVCRLGNIIKSVLSLLLCRRTLADGDTGRMRLHNLSDRPRTIQARTILFVWFIYTNCLKKKVYYSRSIVLPVAESLRFSEPSQVKGTGKTTH